MIICLLVFCAHVVMLCNIDLIAIYLASVELSAISVCSFFDQCIDAPASTMMNPVRDRHDSHKCANS
jgi:hypothetical protein